MVRRFVHQQYIRHSEQDPCQRNPQLPSAGESAHVAINLIIFELQTPESQTVEHFTGLRFERVTAQMLVLLLNVTEAVKDAVHVISLLRVRHFPLQGFELVV
jgi:response regulator RpfG family c-di-GMP phosphodiesterase